MINSPICLLCGQSVTIVDKSIRGDNQDMSSLYRCQGCDLGFLYPQPDQQFLHNCYTFQYESATTFSGSRLERSKRQARNALSKYDNYLSVIKQEYSSPCGIKIIDYGCGTGQFLQLAQTAGYTTYGMDISKEAARYAAEELNLEVVCSEEIPLDHIPDGSYDVFTLFHVIEHLPDPLAFLSQNRRIIKPGGLIVIATPNYRSLFDLVWKFIRLLAFYLKGEQLSPIDYLRRSFKGWQEITTPINCQDNELSQEYYLRSFQHLYYFTPFSLKMLITKAGFTDIKFKRGLVSHESSSCLKNLFKNKYVDNFASFFCRQEEIVVVARQPHRGKIEELCA